MIWLNITYFCSCKCVCYEISCKMTSLRTSHQNVGELFTEPLFLHAFQKLVQSTLRELLNHNGDRLQDEEVWTQLYREAPIDKKGNFTTLFTTSWHGAKTRLTEELELKLSSLVLFSITLYISPNLIDSMYATLIHSCFFFCILVQNFQSFLHLCN